MKFKCFLNVITLATSDSLHIPQCRRAVEHSRVDLIVYIIDGGYKAINIIDYKDSATLVSIRSAAGNKKKQKAHAGSAETSLDTSLAQFRSLIKQQVH